MGVPARVDSHFEKSVPSNNTTASEGGLPGCSGELKVPGVTTLGCGRLGSWTAQGWWSSGGSPYKPEPAEAAKPAAASNKNADIAIRVEFCFMPKAWHESARGVNGHLVRLEFDGFDVSVKLLCCWPPKSRRRRCDRRGALGSAKICGRYGGIAPPERS